MQEIVFNFYNETNEILLLKTLPPTWYKLKLTNTEPSSVPRTIYLQLGTTAE